MADSMIFLAGASTSFHCECGCNVFHEGLPHHGSKVFVCNGCQTEYFSAESENSNA